MSTFQLAILLMGILAVALMIMPVIVLRPLLLAVLLLAPIWSREDDVAEARDQLRLLRLSTTAYEEKYQHRLLFLRASGLVMMLFALFALVILSK